MGLWDQVSKRLTLPAGARSMSPAQIQAQVREAQAPFVPLPRDPMQQASITPFSAGTVLVPVPINPVNPDTGRTAPRRSEFENTWNTQLTRAGRVSFEDLRRIADEADMVRKCIEIVKDTAAGWDIEIVPKASAVSRILEDQPELSIAAASRTARESLNGEILRCMEWWEEPDRQNGYSLPEWIAQCMEEMLVIDALSIYPARQLGGDQNLDSLIILDGATIKPLLADDGNRPLPPYPAFQQILFGFPRGEFTASADADGQFTSDDLAYLPRTRRTFTPYGYSKVEQAIPVVGLYLKRLGWLSSEFDEGTLPEAFVESDVQAGVTPELLKAYEKIINDDLAGQYAERRRIKLLGVGQHPIFPPDMDERFKPDLDELIVKYLSGHFGVLPSQLGFAAKGGLGGRGVQEGEESTSEDVRMKPTRKWLIRTMNQMSYRFLNMPKDLTFKIDGDDSEDDKTDAERDEIYFRTGRRTMNDLRNADGLPPYTFPEADMPFIGNDVTPAAAAQAQQAQEGSTAQAIADDSNTEDEAGTGDLTEPDDAPAPADASRELMQFVKWSKGARRKPFVFKSVGPGLAEWILSVDETSHADAISLALNVRKALADRMLAKAGGADAGGRGRTAIVGGSKPGRGTDRAVYAADNRFTGAGRS